MVGIAPSAAVRAGGTLASAVAGAVFSGVVAPTTSTWGYHWPADALPADHYTKRDPRDQVMGTQNQGLSCAIDVSNTPANIDHMTRRFRMGLRNNDPRLQGVAEVAGCIGDRIWAWTHGVESWDRYDGSHRWHNHIGIWRTQADGDRAWDDLAAFMSIPDDLDPNEGNDDDMAQADIDAITKHVDKKISELNASIKAQMKDLQLGVSADTLRQVNAALRAERPAPVVEAEPTDGDPA